MGFNRKTSGEKIYGVFKMNEIQIGLIVVIIGLIIFGCFLIYDTHKKYQDVLNGNIL